MSRILDNRAHLNGKIFAFAIQEILTGDTKRIKPPGRLKVTLADLLLGMILKGNLTRYVLRRQGTDPDELYEKIDAHLDKERETAGEPLSAPRSQTDAENSAAQEMPASHNYGETTEAKPTQSPSQKFVFAKEEFSRELIALLMNADAFSQKRHTPTEKLISEQDVLECLIADATWEKFTGWGLPPAAEIRQLLQERERSGEVDENGIIALQALDSAARKIIVDAHHLAQQRGVRSITNRLMLAAILMDTKSYGAKVFRSAGLDPERLAKWMIAMTEEEGSHSFGLSMEACERIVLPVLNEARKNAPVITARDLFKAFCEQADPAFKAMLKQASVGVDLDRLKSLDPVDEVEQVAEPSPSPKAEDDAGDILPPEATTETDSDLDHEEVHQTAFEDSVWRTITAAGELAWFQGLATIRTPHLFAALIGDGANPVSMALRWLQLQPEEVKKKALDLVPQQPLPPRRPSSSHPYFGENAQKVLVRAVQIAKSKGRSKATTEDVLASILADESGVVVELLRNLA